MQEPRAIIIENNRALTSLIGVNILSNVINKALLIVFTSN
jgi:hypothetical protein